MSADILTNDELAHIGVLRKSGRFPWGSGENPNQRNKAFLSYVEDLQKKGLSEVDIAKGLGIYLDDGEISTTQLRALKAIAKNQLKAADISEATRYKEKNYSNVAIGERMGINESSVRALLAPGTKIRNDQLTATSNMLKDKLAEEGGSKYLDIGSGVENHLGISGTKLSTAVAILQEEGYVVHSIPVKQLGTGKETTVKVLAPPNTEWAEVINNRDQIGSVAAFTEDGGNTYIPIVKPAAVSAKRLDVRYGDDGGAEMDGVIELRRGVDDVSLGGARYAQVRIAVEGDRYLKGMAVYSDDLPDGVDLRFNTNKNPTGNKLDALKKINLDDNGGVDEENPFGAVVTQKYFTNPKGERELSAINIVNEEGDWNSWSKNLSSQMLSKQSPALAKQQLDLAFKSKQDEFDEIMSLTNPVVQKKLLTSFADGADSSAVHLKAASMPRQRTQVILPVNAMKDTEIFAPNFRDGESVVLVRYPHGGIFEIPELTVNNRVGAAKSMMGGALDAVGINARVAERLSGADFDGDTVLVIPNNSRSVKTSQPLEDLKGFNPQSSYPAYEGMKPMSARAKQQQMGDVSNLITDMTIKGAPHSEIARAVKHSMVVIDAEKHNLNYRQSAKDNQIKQLKTKYQRGGNSGADTLISRASSELRVNDRRAARVSEGGPLDLKTGAKRYTETGAGYTNASGKWVPRTTKSTKMAEATDAFKLSSGTPMESVYATHANRLKAMANQARKSEYSIKNREYNPSAKKAYDTQVQSLKGKLNVALKNAPLERQAQLLANTMVDAKRKANPNIESDALKKEKNRALKVARSRTGADKQRIVLTPVEWQAIQSGAISSSMLNKILDNTDLDEVKRLATPRATTSVSPAKMSRARSMRASGVPQADIADALGVPVSTLNDALLAEGA